MIKSSNSRAGTLLLWLVLAVSLPWLAFSSWTVWRLQRIQLGQQQAALVSQARDSAWRFEQWIRRLQDGLLTLAASTALAHADHDEVSKEMRRLSSQVGDIPITLLAADGTVFARVPELGPSSTQPLPTRSPLRLAGFAAIKAAAPVVTNLLDADGTPGREVAVAVSRSEPSMPRYAIVAEIDTARLARLAEPPVPPADGLVITIRDRDGTTVARSRNPDQHVGEPPGAGSNAAISGRPFGLLPDDAASAATPAMHAFSLVEPIGFTVVASQPQSALAAVIRRDMIQTLLAGATLLIAGLVAAARLGRRLVRALQLVGQGGPAAVPSGLREVDELAARLQAESAARAASETTLRDSESRLRDLLGMLDLAAIMVREVSGTIRFWSHGCTRLYGWSCEQAVGQSSNALLRTQFPEPLPRIEETLLRTGEWNGDLVHRRSDGSSVIVAAHKVLKRDLDGRPHLVMESLVDVTALRAAQDSLRELNEDLERRVRSEIAAREAAQRRAAHAGQIQALGQLASGIAHDFNNVLQAVAGGAALITSRPDDAEATTRLARIISEAANRGASITNRVLLMARQGDLKAEPIEAASLLDGMREVFVLTLGAAIDVRVEVAAGLPWMVADRVQLETALVNLGTNARDAMPSGGIMRLTAGLEVVPEGDEAIRTADLAPGTYVRLAVIDNGVGMSEATLARVAEPFFTTKDVGKGTGLGLSMVKAFADRSGGGFAIESAVGAGTKATLWLPRARGDARALTAERKDRSAAPLVGHILLVDDDTAVRDTLTDQLEALGHRVLAASNGTDALAILRARKVVDLMITDLSMPGMSGLALIKEARDLRPSLPAILLTGFAGDASALDPVGAPRLSYTLIRKPAKSAVLNARVTALLDR